MMKYKLNLNNTFWFVQIFIQNEKLLKFEQVNNLVGIKIEANYWI